MGVLSQQLAQQHAVLQHITDPHMATIASTTANIASKDSIAMLSCIAMKSCEHVDYISHINKTFPLCD